MKLPLIRPHAPPTTGEDTSPADEPIESTLRTHFSYSQLSMYLRCSMQYYFRYILGLVERPKIALATGSGVHGALEWNARHKMSNKIDMPIDDLRDLTSDLLDIEYYELEEDNRVKGTTKDQAINTVAFFRKHQAPSITPIAVEHPFRLVVPPDDDYPDPLLPVIGFVDTYAEIPRPDTIPGSTRKVIALEDYKYVSQRRSQIEVDTTPQLTLYDYVFNQQTGTQTDIIGYRMFGFNSSGPFATPIYRDRALLNTNIRQTRWSRLLQQIRRVQDAINKGIFIPTDDAKTCSWCGYRDRCQYNLIPNTKET